MKEKASGDKWKAVEDEDNTDSSGGETCLTEKIFYDYNQMVA